MSDEIKMHYIDPEEPLHEGMSKREYISAEDLIQSLPDGSFIIKGSSDCIARDAVPSEECKEYHKNSCIQIGYKRPIPEEMSPSVKAKYDEAVKQLTEYEHCTAILYAKLHKHKNPEKE